MRSEVGVVFYGEGEREPASVDEPVLPISKNCKKFAGVYGLGKQFYPLSNVFTFGLAGRDSTASGAGTAMRNTLASG